jgi:cell division protein FtsQ
MSVWAGNWVWGGSSAHIHSGSVMDIKVGRNKNDALSSRVKVPPDRGQYLRRRTDQKLKRRQAANLRFVRILSFLGRVAAVMLVVMIGVYLFTSAFTSNRFNLGEITFKGCKELDPEYLEIIVRDGFAGNLLRIDLDELRTRLEEEIWVEKAEIRRILPSRLNIYIKERVPCVIAELQGELVLTDKDGVFLDEYNPNYEKLDVPVFRGLLGDSAEQYLLYEEENSRRVQQGMMVLSALGEHSSSYPQMVSEIDLSDTSNIRLLLVDDNVEIQLGDRDFSKRFNKFILNKDKYEELKSEYEDIVTVDLRFKDRIIYHPKSLSGDQVASRR